MRVMSILGCLLLAACSIGNPGNGGKVGQIAKITNEGIFCTTMTVLVTGKFGGGELHVTVDNRLPDLQAQVRHFQDTQEQVEVKYHSTLFMSLCSNETNNVMLDSVTAHPEGAAK